METVYENKRDEESNMQSEKLNDRIKKEYIFAGVLGIAVAAVLVYAVVKNINNK